MNFISIIATVAVNDTGTIWSMMSFVFSTASGTVSMDGTDYHVVYDEYCI